MAAATETFDPKTFPEQEPMPPPRQSDSGKSSKFTIGNVGTHETNGIGVEMDSPTEEEPAEPAAPAPAAKPEPTADKPATPASSAEPAPPSAKFGSSLPQAQPAAPAAPVTGAEPAKPADKPITLADILKAEGYDDAFIQAAAVYKEVGSFEPFIEARRDFTKMSDEQVLREALVRANKDATPEQLEVLVESEIKDKYKLDPEVFDPNGKEAKAAAVKMQLDASRARAKLIEEGKKFGLPTRDVSAEATQRAQAAAERDRQVTQEFLDSPYMKSVLTGKKVAFTNLSITGENGKVTTIPDFNIELDDPTEVQRVLTDGGATFQKYTTTADGKRDGEALGQMATFLINRKAFIQAWINYGKSLGKEELIEEKSNPRENRERSPGGESKGTLKEAFVKGKHGTAG